MAKHAPVDPLIALEDRLGHRFSNRAWIEEALTHVSVAATGAGQRSYQRLEFLGDRVLGLVAADMLFAAFPDAPEGELSKRLAELVRYETCAAVARDLALGEFLRLGSGERRSGVRQRDAVLADSCEAVIGAIYRDGGLAAAAGFVERQWRARLEAPLADRKDAKTMLQECALARGLDVPSYVDISRSGPDHAPVFEIAVRVAGHPEAIGQGGSKRIAERMAAEAWLKREGLWP